MKKLLNSFPRRLLRAPAVLLMVVCLFVGGAQPFAVGLLTEPWDKLAQATVFAVLTALLALALQGKPPQPGARWALRPGAALAVAAILAGAVGVCVGLWVARGFWR
jgi:hypothetical protein